MFRQLRIILSIAVKDGRLFVADRRAAFLCFAVPIVLASGFGMIFDRPSQRLGECKLPLLLVVEDEQPLTREIVEDLHASDNLQVRLVDRAKAEKEINNRSSGVAVILPSGFSNGVSNRDARPTVVVLHHPLSIMESHWAEGVVTEITMKRLAKQFLQSTGINLAVETPFALERKAISSDPVHPFNSRSHSFSGMTLQYLLFWGMECGLLLLRERQRGMWARLRIAPVPLMTALLGRALSTAAIALLQIAITFSFGYLVFGVTVTGSWAGFLLLAAAASLLAAGFGLLVASLGQTEASARSVFIVVILAVSMLGGLWLPAFLLPKWVQDCSLALPTSWAMRGLDGVTWQGQNFGTVWPCLLAVYLFALTFLFLAMVRFHRLEARFRRGGIA